MRFVCCFVLGLILSVRAWALPALTGQVVDEANMLTPENRENIAQLFKAENINNVILVTVADLQGKTLKSYISELSQAWGLGQEGYDNGVILVMSPGSVRIGVGKALDQVLSSGKSFEIIDKGMKPLLMKGDVNGAAMVGAKGIVAVFSGRQISKAEENPSGKSWLWWLLGFVVVAGALVYTFKAPKTVE